MRRRLPGVRRFFSLADIETGAETQTAIKTETETGAETQTQVYRFPVSKRQAVVSLGSR